MENNIFKIIRKNPENQLTGSYKIKRTEGYDKFGTDLCILAISVGQEYHEGDKFYSLYLWARNKFKTVKILVGDTLQKHNLSFEKNLSIDESNLATKVSGDHWIERNCSFINEDDIIRWDSLICKPAVSNYRIHVDKAFDSNISYKHDVEKVIREFFSRLNKKDPQLYSFDRFKDFYFHAKEYLLEETAVLSYVSESYNCPIFYPGTVGVDKIVSQDGELLLEKNFIYVDLRKRKTASKIAA